MNERPVRDKPFLPACHLSGKERSALMECLESLNWSGFRAGCGGWDVRELLSLTSAEARGDAARELKYLGGPRVRALEALFAEACGARFAVAANSATSALVMALAALDLGPGDEVLVPCMSFHASATAVVHVNAVPVFTEVKPDTLCIDPIDMQARISERTKAVVVVHLAGNTADMDAVMAVAEQQGLAVVEDCAQAPGVSYKGRPVGSFGHAGVFSLTETKNITCGEGGLLVTDQARIAFKARLIRNHGEAVADESWSDEELLNIVGMNYRLTELQAVLAMAQHENLQERNRIRRENAGHLFKRLEQFPELAPQKPEIGADFTCFIAKWRYQPRAGMPDRDELVAAMSAQGIPLIPGYVRMMHEIPMYTRSIAFAGGLPFQPPYYSGRLRYGPGTCPRSEALNRQLLWFCFVHPPQTRMDMEDVVLAFERVLIGR